ncbi:MAG: flavodoxin family protein [Deltaproteobacteria bacterium]|jgi:multimeric flavodoxin WrbA|nr:flavodoxin family protein [Deltaproteobacteria bacterium]
MFLDKPPILGLHLSPRANGSSRLMLGRFQKGALAAGANMEILSVAGLNIEGCRSCGVCYQSGECVIDDDMAIFKSALEKASRIVVGAPVYFYGVPALGKAMIDRVQVFWSRIYKLGQKRTFPVEPKGLILSVGATKGLDLFTPIKLTMKYFFDSLGFPRRFSFVGFRHIEEPGNWPEDSLSQIEGYGRDFALDQLELVERF